MVAGFLLGCGPPGARDARRRRVCAVEMVLGGFLTEAGEYPLLPQPVAPALPSAQRLESEADRVAVKVVDGRRGLYVDGGDAAQGEVLVRVNRARAIEISRKFTPASSLADDAESVLGLSRSFWREEVRVVGDWRLRLAMRLLIEIRRDQTPYFALLPRNVDVPVFWSREETAELQHFELQMRVLRQKIQWEKICELVRQNSNSLDAREVLWAMSIVRSRAFSANFSDRSSLLAAFFAAWSAGVTLPLVALQDTNLALAGTGLFAVGALLTELQNRQDRRRGMLIPVADMMNHFGGERTLLTYEAVSDSFVIRAGSNLANGREVLYDYNENGYSRPNSELVQYYGFAQEDNPQDSYVVCETLNQFFDQRRSERRFGIPDDISRAAAISSKSLSDKVLDGGGVILKADPDGSVVFNKQFLRAVRTIARTPREMNNLLRQVCQRELESKPTSIAQDEALRSKLRSKSGANARRLLAVKYRLGSKRLLRQFIDTLDA